MASSSNSSSSIPQCTYDVFLSFRGEDTRKSFTDHLYTALDRQGIFTFRDDEELERGQPISSKLLEAIQDSKIALVVLSTNYASSSWCLDELVKIVWCMNEKRQIVFPIFYDVHPTDVRKQTGMFKEAFVAHEERCKDGSDLEKEKVQKWRCALTQVANLSGFHLQDRHEAKFVEEIIEAVLDKLNGTFSSLSKEIGPIGIGSRVDELMKLCLRIEKKNDVLFIGIWGMSGIGKTTLARAFYDNISGQFQVKSFLENVREVSKRDGIATLQHKLFSDFQMKSATKKRDVREGTNELRSRLRHKKALIILDDADELEQLQGLAGSTNWFGQGSRIIITTKDEQLLISHGVDKRYKAKELNTYEALKLFSWKVFKNEHPPKEYMELSHDFVNYAKGLPLAIEVLAPFLCGKTISEWESAFRRLKKSLEGKIMSTLLMGFDGLHEEEKEIFLDIACFFKGEDKDYVVEMLESFGLEPIIGISVLLSKSLLTLVGSKLWMHDLLQEMGWAIVRQECSNEPGNRSRLWHQHDVLGVIKNNKGTHAIQGIVLSLHHEEKLASNAFSKMEKLRFLRISNVLLPEGLKYLSTELGVLEWHGYPSTLLPENFPSDKLVHLNMCSSNIKYIWKQYKGLEKLKSINLKDSVSLIETPDFTGAPNLERLVLEGCTKLSKVHPSISNLKRLTILNMKNCKCLRILPCNISLESLEIFNLSGCVQLKRFPEIVGDMECLSTLYLDGTAIKELPMSIERLTCLSLLNLAQCKNILRVPSVLSNMTRLKMIILSGCSNLGEIPENIGNVECLEELDISGTAIRQMPSSIIYLRNLRVLSCSGCNSELSTSLLFPCPPLVCPGTGLLSPASFTGFFSLTSLDLSYCNLFDGAIPNDLDLLSSLKDLYLRGNNFTTIPKSICRLSKLSRLYLEGCSQLQSLPKLPSSIQGVWVNDCTSLESDSDQYEVWDSSERGEVYIIKRSISPMCYVEMSISQFAAWLHRYYQVELSQSLRAAHGLSARVYAIPKWFNNRSRSSSFPVTTPLPKDLNNESKLWIGYALYVGLEILEDFDTSCDLEVTHKFDCYFDIMEGSRDKKTLYHKINVKDIPFTGKIGYWISIPYLWFLEQVNVLIECSRIETQTIIDSPDVEVKISGARLLHEQQDFIGFVLAIKSNNGAARIRKKKKEHSGQEIKSAMKEQGEAVDGGSKIDSTIPLKEHLRSLPSDIECYEGQKIWAGKYYLITGKLSHPQTASILGEILKEYSGQYCLSYSEAFPQCQIPEWFCSVNRPFSTFPLNPLSSIGTGIRWKGIAVCAALTVHSDPSVKWENPRIECRIGINTWELVMYGDFTETLVNLNGPGLIWIWYASRGSFGDAWLNECTSVRVGFETNSEDLRLHSCGHQVVYHHNMEELMETILQCSTTSKNLKRGKNGLSCPIREKEEKNTNLFQQ